MKGRWRVRYVLRPFLKAFSLLKLKELRWDQQNLSKKLAALLGKDQKDVEAMLFEVGVTYVAAAGIGRIPDSLNLLPTIPEMARAITAGFQSGRAKP